MTLLDVTDLTVAPPSRRRGVYGVRPLSLPSKRVASSRIAIGTSSADVQGEPSLPNRSTPTAMDSTTVAEAVIQLSEACRSLLRLCAPASAPRRMIAGNEPHRSLPRRTYLDDRA